MIDLTEHASFVFNMLQHVNSDRRLTPTARSVAFWLTHHLNRETHECWPGIQRLVQLTGFSDKAVRLVIKNLEAAGYIEVARASERCDRVGKWDMKRFMKRHGDDRKKYRTPGKKRRYTPV
jgi:hypothetical protein